MSVLNQSRAVLFAAVLVAGPVFAANAPSIESVLRDHDGKAVTLHLDGGAEISGKVGGLSAVTVHITEITGKEFYDAVIRLDAVSAVTFRRAK